MPQKVWNKIGFYEPNNLSPRILNRNEESFRINREIDVEIALRQFRQKNF